ncbi:discoidin, CUB and LCCL domain-containing protein 1-like [Acipenser ruthenus]|uniref:discoidin, CUB and LCCL domain-containing protein 1-like n=1 Tax=Acipenser ruthenus TaxID=7906 RepID=UPI00145ADA03|nr:discoidin, CUB and LCCL domain-containing protein 1-like [Acipenser ruthenus]
MYVTLPNFLEKLYILTTVLFILCLETGGVDGQEGEGCGHTVQGSSSGTLASRNFPGTYPNDTQCEWRLQAPQGTRLTLVFGDFDLEYSKHCTAGSLTILLTGEPASSIGPLCGNMNMIQKKLTLNSSEVTIRFESGTHRSGRGFLLSYTTEGHSGLTSCMERGTYRTAPQFSALCPAGCRNVSGDIWGEFSQGYRDTSVLCKAAIHAGVISDERGGPIKVSRERSITLYEASLANGVLSKTGPLSEKRLVFHKECTGALPVSSFNASSSWEEVDRLGRHVLWSPGNADLHSQGPAWAAGSSEQSASLEVDLGERRNITGIITKGSAGRNNFYVKSYKILYSKDRKLWKVYKSASSKEEKVFEGNTDNEQEVRNDFIPPIVARYILIQPQTWYNRVSLRVSVLGCATPRIRSLRPVAKVLPVIPPTVSIPEGPTTTGGPVIIKNQDTGLRASNLVVILAVVGLLVVCVLVLVLCLCRKKRKNAAEVKCSLVKGCQSSGGKMQGCCRGNLPLSESELISYPVERVIPGDLSKVPLTDYAEPDLIAGGKAGQKTGSTFRPATDEGYTIPLILNHYDVPGQFHEYAEPLPAEPEYATPFTEPPPDPGGGGAKKNICVVKVVPPCQGTGLNITGSSQLARYDCPAQRSLFTEGNPLYNIPQTAADGARKASVVYAEPQARDSLNHMYHEPL